ncbi:MAG: bifunctional DNA primase/polymerase, partial [Planctomycetota bacterium]|nr:bifunctional DNA primase/polymerase [Planctomycetota bacterium]
IPHHKKAARVRWGKYQKDRPGDKQLRRWFSNGKRNIAVVLGEVSGNLTCRDFDTVEEYMAWASRHPRLSKTLPTVRTANGYHVYFIGHVEGIRHIENGELRGSGGYCLLPPSLHPDGRIYEWVNPFLSKNLWSITPEIAGFIRNVTEHTEKTEQTEHTEAIGRKGITNGAETKPKGKNERKKNEIAREIEKAITETLPQEVRTRNRQIFEFARALRSLPQFADADLQELRDIVKVWHERALPNIRTKEFEETWIDFLKAWPIIKHEKGEGPMAKIFEKAIQLDPPKIAVKKYPDHSKLKILVSLCRELQRAAGDAPFFLAARTAGRLLNVAPITANRWLFLLLSDGILKLVSKGGTATNARQASRYRYVAN